MEVNKTSTFCAATFIKEKNRQSSFKINTSDFSIQQEDLNNNNIIKLTGKLIPFIKKIFYHLKTHNGKKEIETLISFIWDYQKNENKFEKRYQINIITEPDKSNSATVFLYDVTHIIQGFRKIIMISEKAETDNSFVLSSVISGFDFNIFFKNHEYKVLHFLLQGFTSAEIGLFLNLSEHTVNDYRKAIYKKFKAENIYQLIKHAKKKEII